MSDGSHSIRATAVDDTPVVATVIGDEKKGKFEKRIKQNDQRTVSTSDVIKETGRTCVQCV